MHDHDRTAQGLVAVLRFFEVLDRLRCHVNASAIQAFAAGDDARHGGRDPESLKARPGCIHDECLECLGVLPESDAPSQAVVTGVIAKPGLRMEKIVFEARPGAAVPSLCGLCIKGMGVPRDEGVFRHLAAVGVVVLTQDPVRQGGCLAYHEPTVGVSIVSCETTEHDQTGTQCLALGDSLVRYFLHDAMRGRDYLCFMMMADPRMLAVVQATFLMNRESCFYAGDALSAVSAMPFGSVAASPWPTASFRPETVPRIPCSGKVFYRIPCPGPPERPFLRESAGA